MYEERIQHSTRSMSRRHILALGFAQAFGIVAYLPLVVAVMVGAGAVSHLLPELDSNVELVLYGSWFLLLFIVSASITAGLAFGYPLALAFRQRVREGALLAVATIGWLVLGFAVLSAAIALASVGGFFWMIAPVVFAGLVFLGIAAYCR